MLPKLSIAIPLFILIAIPAFIILFPLFCILRVTVFHLSVFRKDLSKLIDPRSNLLAVDDIYCNPRSNIFVEVVVKGNLEIEGVRKLCYDQGVQVKNSSGQLRNKELKQYPYQWMGFLFWRWEGNFAISQHVKYNEIKGDDKNGKVSKSQLREMYSKLLSKPFEKDTSPWEVIIIQNVDYNSEEPHSVLLVKWHHCLADGFSMLNVVLQPLFGDEVNFESFVAQPASVATANPLNSFFSYFKMVMLAPHHLLKHVLDSDDQNAWIISGSEFKNEYLISSSENIPLTFLKEIKIAHGVGLTAVIYAGLAGAIRKTMLKNGQKVPKNIHCTLPIPMENRPDELTNHASLVSLRLPIGEKEPVKRLKIIQRNIDELKGNLVPVILFYLGSALGTFFPCMIKQVTQKSVVTVTATSFPGPRNKLKLLGHELVGALFYVGPTFGTIGTTFTSLTYGEGIRLTFTVNTAILHCQNQVDEVQNAIQEEFNILKS